MDFLLEIQHIHQEEKVNFLHICVQDEVSAMKILIEVNLNKTKAIQNCLILFQLYSLAKLNLQKTFELKIF